MTADHGMSPEAIAEWRARWGVGPHLTADVVVLTLRPLVRTGNAARLVEPPGRLSVLLIERGIPPYQGRHALPGGFVQLDEPLEAAARRELAEETRLDDLDDVVVDQLATFGDPDRDPRGRTVTVAYTALVPWDRVAHARGGDDAAAARFFAIEGAAPVDEHGAPLRLAFDHDRVVRMAVERLRARVTYTTAPFALMPKEFTLAELQAAYEAILGRALHRRAFRERVEREGWVVETGKTKGGAHRPARVFRAATRDLLWMRPWPEAAKVTGGMKTRPTKRTRAAVPR